MKQIKEGLKVDVAAYNSKFYYVITDGGGYGEQVVRVPCTGNETVLDAVAQIQGLPAVASKKLVWVARATPGDSHHPYILPVDWRGIAQRGEACTNYQIYPGDRIYVNSNPFIRADSYLAKFLAPFERALGFTLLGSSVVNSIKNGSNNGGGGVTR
jgi:polysaccharide export outer membrane protein